MKPTVSVVIPAFNHAATLTRAVTSALEQTYAGLECLIVDDGSTDHTRRIAKQFLCTDPRVRYVFQNNSGVAAARNLGVSRARGQYLQFLDADDWLAPEKIEVQLRCAQQFCAPAPVIYSDFEIAWENADGDLYQRQTMIVGDHRKSPLNARFANWSMRHGMPLHLNAILFPREILEHHRFDESLKAFEDTLFLITLLENNVSFHYVPYIGMTYRVHAHQTRSQKNLVARNYLHYLEAIRRINPALLATNPNMNRLIFEALRQKDLRQFHSLLSFIRDTEVPITCFGRNRPVGTSFILKKLYYLRSLMPERLWTRVAGKALQVTTV